MGITLKENAEQSDLKSLSGFFKNAYREDIAVADERFFRWLFSKNRTDDRYNMFIALSDEKIAGTLGYIPSQAFWGSTETKIPVAYTVNWYFLKEFSAVSWAPVRRLKKTFKGIISTQQSEFSEKLLMADKWSVGSDMQRLVCVSDNDKAEELFGKCSLLFKANNTNDSALNFANMDNYAPDWNLYTPMHYGVIRDADFLRWRYLSHPCFRYHIASFGDSGSPAVCVFRIIESFGDFEIKTAKITDFFHPDGKNGSEKGIQLLNSVINHTKKLGCVYTEMALTCSKYKETAEYCGFRLDSDHIFPSKLTPVNMIPDSVNYVHSEKSDRSPYISYGDADMDRPSSSSLI